jgi:tetratricopeptide (TPR) repeat protein
MSVAALFVTAGADDAPDASEAIEQARALARDGYTEHAEAYLLDLVATDGGPLADEPEVLLEAARLASDVTVARSLAFRAIEHTRSSRIVHAARLLRGDSYFAEGLYLTAAVEYEEAAKHAPGRGAAAADLKLARSILASGDPESAVETYEDIVAGSSPDDGLRPEAELGLATALLEAGRAEEAARRFEQAAEAHPDHQLRARALFGAARSVATLGDIARAAELFGQLVETYSDSYEAVLARERLRELEPALSDTAVPSEADSLLRTQATSEAESLPETPSR